MWHAPARAEGSSIREEGGLLLRLMTPEQAEQLALFGRAQLEHVLRICCQYDTRTEAGRRLFGVSRRRKKRADDTTHLNKYLKAFGLNWEQVQSLRYR